MSYVSRILYIESFSFNKFSFVSYLILFHWWLLLWAAATPLPSLLLYTVSLHFTLDSNMEMEPPTAARAAATADSIQALAEALQANSPPAAPSHRLVLSTFWHSGRRILLDGSTMLKPNLLSLASPSIATSVTATFCALFNLMWSLQSATWSAQWRRTPRVCIHLSEAGAAIWLHLHRHRQLLQIHRPSRFGRQAPPHPLLRHAGPPAKGHQHPLQCHYLRRLPKSMQNALAGKGELPPHELAEAAGLLPRPQLAASDPVHLSTPLPPSIAQVGPASRRP